MPGGDRTGPLGAGAMTGRGVGLCSGNDVPGYANPAPGRGFGGGRGFGRGFGRGYGTGYGRGYGRGYGMGYGRGFMNRGVAYPYRGVPDAVEAERLGASEELAELRDQARHYGRVLDEINRRLKELEKAPEKE